MSTLANKKQKPNDKCNCNSSKKFKKCCGYIPSKDSQIEISRIADMSVVSVVKEYIALPDLPMGADIIISKIGIYNYDPTKKDSSDAIKYSVFSALDIFEYPEGKNSDLDYMPNDNVSPVVIIDNHGKKYKVNNLLWFPLCDAHDGILRKQSITGGEVFPVKIFIDGQHQWVTTLLNLCRRG